ncbi:magnesium transporter [Basilea psittacipulmonis DSM 24701]|uniref:Magnesium transporter n=1 Tax=Basilea psittacipulmonis DSM 24701 TaxID=1072685 RepID=A0A077DEB1_9BURK|nr:magnesium transporter [Basilea psittacipulmonis DSM 24701]
MFKGKHIENIQDLMNALSKAHEDGIIADDAYHMMAGSISFAKTTVSDIMTPRSQMCMIDVNKPLAESLHYIIETGHSRFPVYDKERDNIIGLLLVKDLLPYILNPQINLKELIRPAYFVPESKHLNQLLTEFRTKRNHIAIAVDEYGGFTGLLTLEDVLEQIVGDIEDETDEEEEETIFQESENTWRVVGSTKIEDINETLGTDFSLEENITLGGWIIDKLDHIPIRGETYTEQGYKFRVLKSDGKKVLWLHITKLPLENEDPSPKE